MARNPKRSLSKRLGTRWTEVELERWHRLYAMRSQLDGIAARFAAEAVLKGASIASLRDQMGEMQAAAHAQDYSRFLEADMLFHREIAQLAQTDVLPEKWLLLEEKLRPFVSWVHKDLFHDLEIIAATHKPFFEAIAAGDPKQAERLAQVDLDALWQMLASESAEPQEEADVVERVCAYVILNLQQRLIFSEVAREVGHVSPSYLAKLFRARRRESFGEYVQSMRLRRACELLSSTDLTVGDIAARVGYADVSRFGSHFRKRYTIPPGAWRQQTKREPGLRRRHMPAREAG